MISFALDLRGRAGHDLRLRADHDLRWRADPRSLNGDGGDKGDVIGAGERVRRASSILKWLNCASAGLGRAHRHNPNIAIQGT